MKPKLEDITGFLGVGTLEILGIFFILDGLTGFLTFIEAYSKTSSWAILVTVPILVFAYVFGLLTSLGTEMFINRAFSNNLLDELFGMVVSLNKDFLTSKFLEVERQSTLLSGCAFAFLLLAIGSLLEVPMMGRFSIVGYIGFLGGLFTAILCPILGRQLQRQLHIRLSSINKGIDPNMA